MRPITTTRLVLAVLCVLLVMAFSGCDNDSSMVTRPSSMQGVIVEAVTLDDVQAAPITSLVETRIVVETRVLWEIGVPICDPKCPEERYATPIAMFFENGDTYVPERWRGQRRGNMFLVSEGLTTEFNEDKVEEYYFNGELLDRNVTYQLTGAFSYRDWIAGGEPPLDNPEFIEQSNKVMYWSQTFEFRLEDVRPITQ